MGDFGAPPVRRRSRLGSCGRVPGLLEGFRKRCKLEAWSSKTASELSKHLGTRQPSLSATPGGRRTRQESTADSLSALGRSNAQPRFGIFPEFGPVWEAPTSTGGRCLSFTPKAHAPEIVLRPEIPCAAVWARQRRRGSSTASATCRRRGEPACSCR